MYCGVLKERMIRQWPLPKFFPNYMGQFFYFVLTRPNKKIRYGGQNEIFVNVLFLVSDVLFKYFTIILFAIIDNIIGV